VSAKRVVIGCAADGGYALPLAVMLRSVAARLDPACALQVYAVDGGLSHDDRERITRSVGERATLRWMAPVRADLAGVPLWGRMPIATYDKLAIARWIPEAEERVIWLDADLLVVSDLAELWSTDVGAATIGATQDARVPTVDARFGVSGYAAHGLARDDKYFNAGVMLIDLARWRANDVEGRALSYLRRHRERVYFWDQEALNVALAAAWSELAPAWNWSPTTGRDGASADGASPPRILHFSGHLKPWRYPGRSAPHELYYADLDQTAWAGWRPAASVWATGVGMYERSGMRRFTVPAERWALSVLRAATLRYASAADLATANGTSSSANTIPASDASPRTASPAARMSVVLPADRPETVRRMRAALAAQTARAALEVIVVRWPGAWADGPPLEEDGYAAIRIVDMPAGAPLPEGRAAGARAATTPLVFFAETHAYPRPGWAAAVLAAATRGEWQVISSAFANGNPAGATSWAAFILDYGEFGDDLPAGEVASVPIHKGTFARQDLLSFGDRLGAALSSGDELPITLVARGRRAYFEPAARIDHLNATSIGMMMRGRCLIGFLIGANRSERWSASRRALYALLAPLIVVVLVWRIAPVKRRIGRTQRLPLGTWPVIVLGSLARVAGEIVGYACGHLPSMQARADAYELSESLYVGGGAR
jgi:lipopolysaccharide biosynthesis glycosyltransferase